MKGGNQMPKEIVVTALSNKIEYATTNGKGLITGKREDITEVAINAVFSHLKTEFGRTNKDGKAFGRNFNEHGRLLYLAPGVDVAREDAEFKSLKEAYEDRMDDIESLEKIVRKIQNAYTNGSGDDLDEVLDELFSNETEDLSY